MRASLYKITTDNEGSSRIIFDIPSSELADAVMLLQYIQKELILKVEPAPCSNTAAPIAVAEPESSL